MKKILFISHDASLTGAPILLLNLAKVLKDQDYLIDFLIKNGGDLEAEFQKTGNNCFFATKKHSDVTFLDKVFRRASAMLKIKNKKYNLKKINFKGYNLIISNTITNGDLLPFIRQKYDGNIVSYIHELEQATRFFTNTEDLKQLIKYTDYFLVPSEAVRFFLTNSIKVTQEKIDLMPYYIPPINYEHNFKSKEQDFIVGGSGTIDWRKSPDLFIQIAKTVFSFNPDAKIKFKWRGASKSAELDRLQYDIQKLRLQNKIVFEEVSIDKDSFFEKIDLFLLTSREDPYPLVVLEAAAAAVPTVCFEGTGGAPEFIRQSGGGRAVNYIDIENAAKTILEYYSNSEKLHFEGRLTLDYINRTHSNQSYVFDSFREIEKKIMSSNG